MQERTCKYKQLLKSTGYHLSNINVHCTCFDSFLPPTGNLHYMLKVSRRMFYRKPLTFLDYIYFYSIPINISCIYVLSCFTVCLFIHYIPYVSIFTVTFAIFAQKFSMRV